MRAEILHGWEQEIFHGWEGGFSLKLREFFHGYIRKCERCLWWKFSTDFIISHTCGRCAEFPKLSNRAIFKVPC